MLGRCLFLTLFQNVGPAFLICFRIAVRVKTQFSHLGDSLEFWVTTKHNIGTTTCHVGSHRYGTLAPCLSHDVSLTLIVLGVQYLMAHAFFCKLTREVLRLLNARRTHQNRLSLFMAFLNVFNNGFELGYLVTVHLIRVVNTLHILIRGNSNNTQLVGAHKFRSLSLRSTSHAGKLIVHAEIVLQGYGCHRLVFRLNFDAFFSLNSLMDTIVIAASRKNTTSVLIHDQDFTVDHHIVFIIGKQLFRFDGVIQETYKRSIPGFVQVLNTQMVFNFIDARFENTDGAFFLVYLVIFIFFKNVFCDAREFTVPTVRFTCSWSRDNKRGTRLVNQDRIDLINNGKVMPALYLLVNGPCHIVTQIIEAKLVIRTVGNIGFILFTALVRVHRRENHARFHTKEPVDTTHQIRLVFGKVIIHRHHVHAFATECV